ncbi:hypothetical protein [Labrys neptuniae]
MEADQGILGSVSVARDVTERIERQRQARPDREVSGAWSHQIQDMALNRRCRPCLRSP